MNLEPLPPMLTYQQKQDISAVIATGCDRESAAKYARTTWAAIHAAMDADPEFAAEVRFREANVELHYMSTIRKTADSASNTSNWRASAWWLERLAPERYGPRGTGQVNARQLKLFIEHVSTTLIVDVHNEDDRKRLLAKLDHTAKTLELLLRDESAPEQPTTNSAAEVRQESDDASPDEPSAGVPELPDLRLPVDGEERSR